MNKRAAKPRGLTGRVLDALLNGGPEPIDLSRLASRPKINRAIHALRENWGVRIYTDEVAARQIRACYKLLEPPPK